MVRKLFAVAALFGVLGMSNLYAVGMPSDHKLPPNKGSYGCPPVCGGPGQWDHDYHAGYTTNAGYDNQLVNQQLLTEQQYRTAATQLQTLLVDGENNGFWKAIDGLVAQNKGIFEAQNPDYSKIAALLTAQGYKGSQQSVVAWAEKMTQQQRIAFVNYIVDGGGTAGQIEQQVTLLNSLASGSKHPHGKPPSYYSAEECQSLSAAAAALTFYAAICALLPGGGDAAAALILVFAAGYGLAYTLGCYN